MEQESKISFVLPVYQTEKFLEKCIKSLLEQDYKNLELIFVMDGKSQKAENIIKKFKDKRIIKVLTVDHGGAPKARNEGYKYVTGDYVSFWDSDCYAEPGMVRMWVKIFKEEKVDFVYSGYRFNDENLSFLPSQPWDAYLLTCGNYISTVFPMRKEIFPGFDEKLESLQDWDLWLTLSEKGYKGYMLEGSAFVTEFRPNSISQIGCKPEVWIDRYNIVRKKHNIFGRDICFSSIIHHFRGQDLAKEFKQDYQVEPGHIRNEYRLIYCIGMYPNQLPETARKFSHSPSDCQKVIHWTGDDIEAIFYTMPYIQVKVLAEALNKIINKHFCENNTTKEMLKELGIESEVLPLPISKSISNIPLNKNFCVYYESDNSSKEFFEQLIKSNPDIEFNDGSMIKIEDYNCFMSFTRSSMPSENIKRFLCAGRYVITNYDMLYANKKPMDLKEVCANLREIKKLCKEKKINEKAQKYWLEQTDNDKFIEKVKQCIK